MIFQPITSLKTKTEKDFFAEKCNIFVRLTECYAQKNNVPFTKSLIDSSTIAVLKEFGIISDDCELPLLKKVIGSTEYDKLIIAAHIVTSHNNIKPLLRNINNTERRKLQEQPSDKPTIVDLFCGAGGLSLGFIEAGFRVVLANDIQDVCCETYKYNHPELCSERVVLGDIRQVLDDFSIPESVDLVVGGPPCQGFSSANKHHKVIDDPRNLLYKYFIEAVTKFAPKFVIMENVRGMLKVADQVISDYSDIHTKVADTDVSYIADYRLFNSQYFGVAQSRERLIYIAIRSDIAEKYGIKPADIYEDIEKSIQGNSIVPLKEALAFIKPLDSPRVKGLTNTDDEKTGKKIDINEFSSKDNAYCVSIPLCKGG